MLSPPMTSRPRTSWHWPASTTARQAPGADAARYHRAQPAGLPRQQGQDIQTTRDTPVPRSTARSTSTRSSPRPANQPCDPVPAQPHNGIMPPSPARNLPPAGTGIPAHPLDRAAFGPDGRLAVPRSCTSISSISAARGGRRVRGVRHRRHMDSPVVMSRRFPEASAGLLPGSAVPS